MVRSLDPRTASWYVLTVVASDHGSPRARPRRLLTVSVAGVTARHPLSTAGVQRPLAWENSHAWNISAHSAGSLGRSG